MSLSCEMVPAAHGCDAHMALTISRTVTLPLFKCWVPTIVLCADTAPYQHWHLINNRLIKRIPRRERLGSDSTSRSRTGCSSNSAELYQNLGSNHNTFRPRCCFGSQLAVAFCLSLFLWGETEFVHLNGGHPIISRRSHWEILWQ